MPPRKTQTDDLSRLTDAECDFIAQRLIWGLQLKVSPMDFFRDMGRGVVFEVKEENKSQVRNLIRLFAHGDTKT